MKLFRGVLIAMAALTLLGTSRAGVLESPPWRRKALCDDLAKFTCEVARGRDQGFRIEYFYAQLDSPEADQKLKFGPADRTYQHNLLKKRVDEVYASKLSMKPLCYMVSTTCMQSLLLQASDPTKYNLTTDETLWQNGLKLPVTPDGYFVCGGYVPQECPESQPKPPRAEAAQSPRAS